MANELNKIERTYDAVAEEYAKAFFAEHEKKPRDREILQKFARELGERRPVWDLGSGPGQTAKYLKDLGLDINGLDLSEKMVAQASALYPEIPFCRGNILELGFAGDSLAGAVAFYAIVHFTEEEVRKALQEVWRVLQPGGIFLFTFHLGEGTIHVEEFLSRRVDIDFMFFSSGFIRQSLSDIGFEGIELIERDPYPGVEYQSRRAYVFARKPSLGFKK